LHLLPDPATSIYRSEHGRERLPFLFVFSMLSSGSDYSAPARAHRSKTPGRNTTGRRAYVRNNPPPLQPTPDSVLLLNPLRVEHLVRTQSGVPRHPRRIFSDVGRSGTLWVPCRLLTGSDCLGRAATRENRCPDTAAAVIEESTSNRLQTGFQTKKPAVA
jgi:hypothetical protein